jgi:CubicO group peptidase (beta-lactamase class C family)
MAVPGAIRRSCCAVKSCYSYAAGLPAESEASSEGMMRRIALSLVVVAMAGTQSLMSTRAAGLYFPPAAGEWARVQPSAAGWDERALNALDYAGTTNSSGVVVLLDGRILAERRWPVTTGDRYSPMVVGKTAGGDAVEDVASAQKSVVALLAGVAEGKRQLALSIPVDRYLGKGWSKAPAAAEAAITVRHLMTMTTGLNDAGVRRPWSAGNDAANTIGFATTARDLARFGLLVLAQGSWNGRDLLQNAGYLGRMLRPSQDLNPSYGLLWWLNGQSRVQRPDQAQATRGSLIPAAPRDLTAGNK